MVRSYLHAQSIVQNLACPGLDSINMILSGLELLVQKVAILTQVKERLSFPYFCMVSL